MSSMSETESCKNYSTSLEISHELDEEIYKWYSQCLHRGLSINESMIRSKALSLCQEFKEEISFNKGWLNRWRRKYGIMQLPISGAASSASSAGLDFDKRFKKLIKNENLSHDQIFTCSDTGLYYKMLPTNNLITRSESTIPGFTVNSNRVTIMACYNASGSMKLPLLLIGKVNKPNALKTINPNSLPLIYRYQKSAWVDAVILKEWFDKEFVPRVRKFLQEKDLPQKAILIIDDAPLHASEEKLRFGNIGSTLLHVNVPSTTKLINREILSDLKKRYRHRLLSSLLEYQNDEMDVMKRLSDVNLKDVVFWLAAAWTDVSALGIQKVWKRLWHHEKYLDFEEDDSMSTLDLVELCVQIEGCTEVDNQEVQELTEIDNRAMYRLSDEEIIATVLQSGKEEPTTGTLDGPKVYPEDAKDAIERLIAFFESQEVLPEDLVTLNNLKSKIKSFKNCQSLAEEVDPFL